MSDAVLKAWHVERPAVSLRPWPTRVSLALVGAALAVGFLAASASILAAALSSSTAVVPPAAPPPRPRWIDIQTPVHIFDLSAPALEGLPLVYSARRPSLGDGREDLLAFGTLEGNAPALRLKLRRRAAGPPAPVPLFAALAREAADTGLAVSRSGLPDLMTTRFGRFEIADIQIAGVQIADSVPRSCSGFRLILNQPALSMTGLACGTPTRPLARRELACLLDRLDLASAGDDPGLRDFFAATELKRNAACAGMRLGPDGLHAAWLDDTPATPRKRLRRR